MYLHVCVSMHMYACVCLFVSHVFGTPPHANTPESHHTRSLRSGLLRGIYNTGVIALGEGVVVCFCYQREVSAVFGGGGVGRHLPTSLNGYI